MQQTAFRIVLFFCLALLSQTSVLLAQSNDVRLNVTQTAQDPKQNALRLFARDPRQDNRLIYLKESDKIYSLSSRLGLQNSERIQDVQRLARQFQIQAGIFDTAGENIVLSNETPYMYAAFMVINESDQNLWTFDLHAPQLAKQAQLQVVELYDGLTGRKVYTKASGSSDHKTILNLDKNIPYLFVTRLAVQQNTIGTITPKLYASSSAKTTSYQLTKNSLVLGLTFSLLPLYFLFWSKKRRLLVTFLSLNALVFLAFLIEKIGIINLGSLSSLLHFDTLLGLFAVSFALSAWQFHKAFGTHKDIKLIWGFGFLLALVSLFFLLDLNIFNGATPLMTKLPYGGVLISLMCIWATYIKASYYNEKRSIPLVFSSTLLWVAFLISALGLNGFIPVPTVTLIAFSLAIILNGFVSAHVLKSTITTNQSEINESLSGTLDSSIKQKLGSYRENFDQTRLKQILQRERKVMQELREKDEAYNKQVQKAIADADAAIASKSAFLAMISHEIRTPMTGIMGMVHMLKGTKLDDTQIDCVETIDESGKAMITLLNDILDFEKIETGKMGLENISMDLHKLMKTLHALLSSQASIKNIHLRLTVEKTIPQFVMGDPTRLRQVILNLANNAIKFTEKGTVDIIVKLVEQTDETKSHGLYFAVKDTGIGISKDVQSNLFNPFEQAGDDTNRKYGGSGLGLAISQKLVNMMGGQISIKSEEGAGSTFFFNISMDSDPKNTGRVLTDDIIIKNNASIAPPVKKVADNNSNLQKKHAFFVDDNHINRKVMRALLSEQGMTTEEAINGEDTLQKLKRDQKYDVIFMDIELPGLNGITATHELRKSYPQHKDTPIIALTGHTSPEDAETFYAAGMNDVLTKPIEEASLVRILKKVEEGSYKMGVKPQGNPQLKHKKENTTDFDAQAIESIKSSLDEASFKDMIDECVTLAKDMIEQIKLATKTKDYNSLRARAHELKGMVGNFGLTGLSTAAGVLEDMCENQDTISDDKLDLAVKELIARSETGFDAIDAYTKA